MVWPVVAAAGVAALGAAKAISSRKAADRAARAQQAAAQRAADVQLEMYKTTRKDLKPYREEGASALERYSDIVLRGNIKKFQESPGYQFRLQEGIKALERGAAARGGLLGGRQTKALTEFGQGLASQEYGNYLAQLDRLMSLGQASAVQTGGAGAAAAQQAGPYIQGYGAAQASGIIGKQRQTERLMGVGQQFLSSVGGMGAGGAGGMAGGVSSALGMLSNLRGGGAMGFTT